MEFLLCPFTQAGIDGEFGGGAHGDESRDGEVSGEFHMKAKVVCSNKTSKKRSTQPYLYVQLAY